MRLVRLLLYVLASLAGLYLLAAVLYAIPVISGVLDDNIRCRLMPYCWFPLPGRVG